MRIQRLDLLRYGHFTGTQIELPAGPSDFHILFGPNEAGKSTALTAIEDLLFGIPTRRPTIFCTTTAPCALVRFCKKGAQRFNCSAGKAERTPSLMPTARLSRSVTMP